MDLVYAPGCALTIYKPHLAKRMHSLLVEHLGEMEMLDTCCRNFPELRDGVQVINTCPGCDRRYRNNYTRSTTKSVWEIIAEGDWFPLPDYHGARMSIHDACPTRDQPRVHNAIRNLLKRMNVELVEPERTGTAAVCCGDSYYPSLSVGEVNEQIRRRASEMPEERAHRFIVRGNVSSSLELSSTHHEVCRPASRTQWVACNLSYPLSLSSINRLHLRALSAHHFFLFINSQTSYCYSSVSSSSPTDGTFYLVESWSVYRQFPSFSFPLLFTPFIF